MAAATVPAVRALFTIRPMLALQRAALRRPSHVGEHVWSQRRTDDAGGIRRFQRLDGPGLHLRGVQPQIGGRRLDEQHAAAAGQAEVGIDDGRRLRRAVDAEGDRQRAGGGIKDRDVIGSDADHRHPSRLEQLERGGHVEHRLRPAAHHRHLRGGQLVDVRGDVEAGARPAMDPADAPGGHHPDAGQRRQAHGGRHGGGRQPPRGEQRAEVTGARLGDRPRQVRQALDQRRRPLRPPARRRPGRSWRAPHPPRARRLRRPAPSRGCAGTAAHGRSGSTRAPPPPRRRPASRGPRR